MRTYEQEWAQVGHVNPFKKRDYFDDVQPNLQFVGMGLMRELAVSHREESAENGNIRVMITRSSRVQSLEETQETIATAERHSLAAQCISALTLTAMAAHGL